MVIVSGQTGPHDCLLLPGVRLDSSQDHVSVLFAQQMAALSSAVLNGGFTHASAFLNLRVAREAASETADPAQTLAQSAKQLGIAGTAVGMMTAASMASLRVARETCAGYELVVVLTSGLDNARRAGDPADWCEDGSSSPPSGTINMSLFTSASLRQEAMVEVLTIMTEAKAALLQDLGIRSPRSGAIATGTGTDAVAVFCASGGAALRYAGKHTAVGECIARLVLSALRDSIDYPEAAY